MTGQMEDHWLWYLAGSFDTQGTIKVKISTREDAPLGYEMFPELYYSRPEGGEVVLQMFCNYAESVGAEVRLHDAHSDSRLSVRSPSNIRRFLEPLLEGFVQQRDRAEFILNQVLPRFTDGQPTTKREFVEVVETIDAMNGHPIQRRTTKYDAAYFRDAWDL